jgi:hypothetical protein
MSYAHIDYNVIENNISDIAALCINKDFVILDNADLYLTDDIITSIQKTAKYILISIKEPYGIFGDEHICDIEYSDNNLYVR